MGHGARRGQEAVGGSGRWGYRIEDDGEEFRSREQEVEEQEEAEKNDERWRNNTECTSG